MLFWISRQIIISVIIIVLVHSSYKFLQNNLTTPKVKVNTTNDKYKDIYKTIHTEEGINNCVNTASMKNELESYLKELSTEKCVSNNYETV